MERLRPELISNNRNLFFTGKGGVGKTSTACATAVALAELGKQVLIVSTDPASNLQDVFEMELETYPTQIPTIPNLYAANLDPEQAALEYREKIIGPYRGKLPQAAITNMEEQLSGACTVEIAAFDEFTNLLANEETTKQFDHIIFDTAPTGHTLRLLQLPTAWNSFLDESTHGASCLGPLAGLEKKKSLYKKTMRALANKEETLLVLVARPDRSSLDEAKRASLELNQLGITNQSLIINGVFKRQSNDLVACKLEEKQQQELKGISNLLYDMRNYFLPLVPYNLTGINALKNLFIDSEIGNKGKYESNLDMQLPSLEKIVAQLSNNEHGVFMTMGKGGVGKTTMAAAVAVGLAEKGHKVHLTTTDPAAHLMHVLDETQLSDYLTVSSINPKHEVDLYKKQVLEKLDDSLTEDEIAFVKEDLESPCTEEIAVFQAFAKAVDLSDDAFVVIDTAPTGHTLLLLDAAESYHQEVERANGKMPAYVQKLIPRLRDPNQTFVALVTLPEATPVHEANRLQEDLRRAKIEPKWWIINQSFQATTTEDPVLKGRAYAEQTWIERVFNELASETIIVPWQADDIIGVERLKQITKA
ncbi:arsenical pump-driving ATPase [Aquibacillus rhizosphaerae]|uniref:Arsenical pump-driving ATPase n=1 Tax=Aquibacillus rhizosphaerae TaxID=3051431 RepID=A0ABT7L5U5_9BACI|nr:arsenical pump-driving ATPase [Aquibacillus sp. LR5S19]MDL4841224.1 arsenical pump-driving ATPase [Aquibacillus sp. LR5S19]